MLFRSQDNHYVLSKCKFWNMPTADLDGDVQSGWLQVKNTLINGVRFNVNNDGSVSNNLLGKHDNRIVHIRPHATKSAYRLNNGFVRGNVERDANELPDGQWMTTQSFWINNDYILKQL